MFNTTLLRDEAAQLDGKLASLRAFLNSEEYGALGEDDQQLLVNQAHVMSGYVNILYLRIYRLENPPAN